jgi:hypothetical protein
LVSRGGNKLCRKFFGDEFGAADNPFGRGVIQKAQHIVFSIKYLASGRRKRVPDKLQPVPVEYYAKQVPREHCLL